MKRQRWVAALIAAICLFAAGGAQAASGQVVTVWSWFIASTMAKSIQAFEAKNPGIVVKYSYYNYSPEYLTALKAAAASNSLPDLIGLQPGSLTQQYRAHLVPLDSYAAREWGADWAAKIFPVDRRQMTMGNPPDDHSTYILPQESQVLAIWYNRDLFTRLGLKPPGTYAELVGTAKTLAAHGIMPMFQGAADGWQNENVYLMLADQLAPGLIDRAQAGQAPWTSPALVQAMHAWAQLFKDGVFQQGALGAHAYPTGAQLFAQGRIGMMALGSWWMQEAKYPPPLPSLVKNMQGFDFFMFPALSAGSHASPPVGGIDIGYGMTKAGAKNPAAWKFLASLVQGAGLQAALNDLNDLPSIPGWKPEGDISGNIQAMYARFMAALPQAQNQRFGNPEIADALDNALAGVAAGKLTPESALQQVQAVTNRVLGKG